MMIATLDDQHSSRTHPLYPLFLDSAPLEGMQDKDDTQDGAISARLSFSLVVVSVGLDSGGTRDSRKKLATIEGKLEWFRSSRVIYTRKYARSDVKVG